MTNYGVLYVESEFGDILKQRRDAARGYLDSLADQRVIGDNIEKNRNRS